MAAPPPLPLAVTMGEPAGIGGEIAVQAWLRRSEGVPPFYLIDDPERLSRLARRCGWTVPIRRLGAPGEAAGAFAAALPVLPIGAPPAAAPGRTAPMRRWSSRRSTAPLPMSAPARRRRW